MSESDRDRTADEATPPAPPRRRRAGALVVIVLGTAVVTAAVTALLTNIFERKQEAKNPYLRFVEVTEDTTDPAEWGKNWPRQYDGYLRTARPTRTKYGGGAPSEGTPAPEKAEKDPWLTRMFAGYAFAIDYRDRRGHAHMLTDQEDTKRTRERPQPGSCLHCHASVMPLYRKAGREAAPSLSPADQIQKGFEAIGKLDYWTANEKLREAGAGHPVSCVDCHDPKTMALRVTRPGFINGIKALKAKEGVKDYDPNRDATRQEMRSFVCGQCHVEYYCGPKTTLFFPWNNGIKVEEIESYYDGYKFPDGHRFYDWQHGETGAEVLKAQHPEFEVWSQGTHAKAGVACADCHMPYVREGAMKVSDHWVRSPLTNINHACQQCHHYPEADIRARVETIQDRHYALLTRAGRALTDMLDAVKAAKAAGVPADTLRPILELQRKAQWRLDFVAAENSMGFHAPQELARILGESIESVAPGADRSPAGHARRACCACCADRRACCADRRACCADRRACCALKAPRAGARCSSARGAPRRAASSTTRA
ncbi:MAG: ammonia-forming cytochrome c nitrite reductase subunit c552 [Minicystis sp.]